MTLTDIIREFNIRYHQNIPETEIIASRAKECFSNINWKLTSLLMVSPSVVEGVSHHFLEPYLGGRLKSHLIDIGLESAAMFGIGVYLSNISSKELKEKEQIQKLLLKNQELARIVETSEDAILRTTPDGIINYWNKGAESIYGYTSAEVLNQSIHFMIPEDRREEIDGFLKKVKDGEYVPRFETKRIKRNGELADVAIKLSPVYNLKGELTGISSIVRDISERKKLEESLKAAAAIDSLTGLYNRGTGLAILEQQVQHVKRNNLPLTLIYVDLNYFSNINNDHGHAEGDNALKYVAKTFRGGLRESDLTVRIGGDEFLIIMPDCNIESARSKIETNIKSGLLIYEMLDGKSLPLTASYGFYPHDPSLNMSIEEMIKRADDLMYVDKTRSHINLDKLDFNLDLPLK